MCYIYQTCKAGQVLRGGAALGDVLGGNTLGPVCLGGDITHTHTHTHSHHHGLWSASTSPA